MKKASAGSDGGLPLGGCNNRDAWRLTYFRSDLADDLTGFGLDRPPTSIPPIRANENMAWFIFDTFTAGASQISR